MLFNRWQLALIVLLVIGFGIYRTASLGSMPSQDLIDARSAEIDLIWHRIDPYPGTAHTDADAEKRVTDISVVSVRRWPVPDDWAAVQAHFEKTLSDAGWNKLGETTSDSGDQLLLFRQNPFHMIMRLTDGRVELRATWSVDESLLVE